MSWTYTGLPDTTSDQGRIDAVRVLIKDTTASNPLLQDEAISFVLDQNGDNIYRAAAECCRALVAGEGTSTTVGDLSISGAGDSYKSLAAEYDRRADLHATPFAGGISASDKLTREQDTDRVQPAITRMLHVMPGTDERVRST